MSVEHGRRAAPANPYARSILDGLRASPKTMESKWLYDAAGSALFERITEVPEYYPTARERAILPQAVELLTETMPSPLVLAEIGSGSSEKTRILLDGLPGLARYTPLDIAAGQLDLAAEGLRAAYPDLTVAPVVADFTEALPPLSEGEPVLIFFPGSTIGNLETDEARALLTRFRAVEGVAGCLIGIDLVKDRATLELAYDDPQGVTAAFNLNLLHRIVRDLDAEIPVEAFRHEARWNAEAARIEMHLVATRDLTMTVEGERFEMRAGETIHTENSHKYTREGFAHLAAEAGWPEARFMTDPDGWFGVFLLMP
ncbi:MAG: L-histidine N(alpha)-methyltransferase [Pseudomonadota bacterium]